MEEDAEYLEFIVKEAKAKKATLRDYIGDADVTDYADLAAVDKAPSLKEGNEDKIALSMLLSNIIDKSKTRTIHHISSKSGDRSAPQTVSEGEDSDHDGDEDVSGGCGDNGVRTRKSRQMTKAIASNRGLTRVRAKTAGNARVTNRRKYVKKLQKLSGKIRKADEIDAHGHYAGESRGITVHVNRSRRIE